MTPPVDAVLLPEGRRATATSVSTEAKVGAGIVEPDLLGVRTRGGGSLKEAVAVGRGTDKSSGTASPGSLFNDAEDTPSVDLRGEDKDKHIEVAFTSL